MKIFTLQGCVNYLHAEDLECCLSSSFKTNSRILLGCRVTNILNPDQVGCYIGPDLVPIVFLCLSFD